MDPDEAKQKFEKSFFRANWDPGDPNFLAWPTFEGVWDTDLKQEEEMKVEVKMQESELETIIDCRTIFDPFHPEKITGHIYDKKLHIQNHGDIVEVAVPTSIKPKLTQTLVWVCAGDREWTTTSEPNQVFFESVAVQSGVFSLRAIYRSMVL